MLEVNGLLSQVQCSVAAAIKDAALESGAATHAMTMVSQSSTPGAGGPLDEMVHHVTNNSQSVVGMRAEVDKLVADLPTLTCDINTRLKSSVGMGRKFPRKGIFQHSSFC